jgi:RIO kinase 1
MWPIQEWAMLRRASAAGVSVPHPVEQTADGMLMEFIGDESTAAPKLAQAKLSADALNAAWAQLAENVRSLTAAGLVHADLSAYNLLWWEDRLVIIDLPQAVEFTTNADAFELLHRDIANVADWFGRRGVAIDMEDFYAELVALAWMPDA